MPVSFSSRSREPLTEVLNGQSRRRRQVLKETASFETIALAPRNDLLPELKLEHIAISALKMPNRRTRKLDISNIAETAGTIGAFGFSVPILVGKDGQIIDGEARVKAAEQLGLSSVPCIRVGHLEPVQERALRQAANRLGQRRDYDLDVLKIEFQELLDAHQPIRNLGFSGAELDQILRLDPVIEKDEMEACGTSDAPVITRPGDVWQLGEHRLLCGDAKELSSYHRLLGEERARLVLTDPPYAVAVSKVVKTRHRDFVEGGGDMSLAEFEAMASAFLISCREVLVDGGIILSFMDWKHITELIMAGKAAGLELINLIAWVKSQAGMGSLWRSQHELVAALKKPGKHCNNIQLGKNGRDRSNCWMVPGAGTLGTDAREMLKDHPTPKPVDMLVDAILDVSDRGDIVLDPFGGSGSTLIACEQSGRVARMIELDPAYCDLIVRRWEKESGAHALLEGSGDRFLAVAELRLSEATAGESSDAAR